MSKFLNLAEDLPGELIMNVDVNDGLTNGTPCIIKKNLITEFMHLQDLALFGFSLPVQILVKKYRVQFSHLYNSEAHSL